MNKNLHVVVLMGGWSSEREVSLTSGKGVAAALRERGWSNVTELDMGRDVAARLAELKPDIVFNALHGTPGEDGTVQGMMDLMGLTLHAQRARNLGHRHRQGADQDGAGAARHPHAGGQSGVERKPPSGRPDRAALCR